MNKSESDVETLIIAVHHKIQRSGLPYHYTMNIAINLVISYVTQMQVAGGILEVILAQLSILHKLTDGTTNLLGKMTKLYKIMFVITVVAATALIANIAIFCVLVLISFKS